MKNQKTAPAAGKLPGQLQRSIAAYLKEHYAEPAVCGKIQKMALPRPFVGGLEEYERALPPEGSPCAPAATNAMSLEEMLQQTDAGFTETLLRLIDQTGKKDSQVYKKANLSKQHFSKIRNNPDYRPTKPTAIALALALELDLEQTRDLIGRAGYALTNSSKFDLIIRYFIEQGNYDVVQINLALYEFDQALLGG